MTIKYTIKNHCLYANGKFIGSFDNDSEKNELMKEYEKEVDEDKKQNKKLAACLIEAANLLGDSNHVLTESILDPINNTRCKEIFDDKEIMKPEVVKFIKDSFELWVKQLNPDMRIFKVIGYKCIGSSTGFQYTDSSDLDVQVIVEMLPGHDFDEIWNLVKILPNGNNVPGTNHPVNYFFVDVKNPTDHKKVENLYNIDTKVWEKQTPAAENEVPVLYVREISRLFTDSLDLLMGRYDRDIQYLEEATHLNPTIQSISENEKQEAIDKCITQVRADLDSMKLADKLIHGFRLQAYDDNNFFHISINYMDDNDPRRSMNEAIYKTLDKFQYREKLREKINEGQKLLDSISPTGDGDDTTN